MNREILFRGRRLEDGKWIYGYYFEHDMPVGQKSYIRTLQTDRSGTDFAVDPDTVGQFTGLTDKNGNKIFEGDILRFPPKDRIEVNNYVSYEVFWHGNDCADKHIGWQMNGHHYHGNVCGRINDFTTCLPKYTEKMIIIGNIYDMKI